MSFDEGIELLLLLGGTNVADQYDSAQSQFDEH